LLWSPDKELPKAQLHWAVAPAGEAVPRLAIRLAIVMIVLVSASLGAIAWLGLQSPTQLLLVAIVAVLAACTAAFLLTRSVLHPMELLARSIA